MTTTSSNFPLQAPVQSFFIGPTTTARARLNAAGSALTFSTYFGAGATSEASLAVMPSGDMVIAGTTNSGAAASLLPLLNPLQPALAGEYPLYGLGQADGWIARLSPAST